MAIQQKAPAQKENFASESMVTYKLSLKSAAKKKKAEPIMSPTVPSGLRVDLIQTAIVFAVIVGILLFMYLKLK
jgi:hypothetical protein